MRHIDAVNEAVEQHIGGFSPDDGADLLAWIDQLHTFFDTQATAFRRVSQHFAGDQPIDRAVTEHIEQLASTATGCSEIAAEAARMLSVKHDTERRRLEDPRPNERLWNV